LVDEGRVAVRFRFPEPEPADDGEDIIMDLRELNRSLDVLSAPRGIYGIRWDGVKLESLR